MNKIKIQNKYFKDSSPLLFIFPVLIIIILLLIFNTKIGLFITIGALLFSAVLIKPKLIYLFLISLFSIEGFAALPGASYPKFIGILLLIGLAMRLAMTKEAIPKDNSYKYFLLFFIGSLVSFIFAKDLSVSVQVYMTYVSLFFLYIFTRYFLTSMRNIHTALDYLFFFTIITFAYLQIKGITVANVESDVPYISAGIGDSNEYASYILVLLPLALYRANNSSGIPKVLYLAYVASFFLLLVYTGSRGGVLGFLGAALIIVRYYGIGKVRTLLLLFLIVTVILYFFIPEGYWDRVATITAPQGEDSSIDARRENYYVALKMFLDHPLAGLGLHNFKFNSMNYGASRALVVHNTYLEILTGGGLLSFIPFILILINSWRKARLKNTYGKNVRDLIICLKASFVSILITSFFITAGHKKIFWFLLALISSAYYIAMNQRTLTVSDNAKAI